MNNISSTKYHNKRYLSGDDLYKNHKSLFSGCRNAREIITKKKVNTSEYIYVKETTRGKRKVDGSDKKTHKVFITESWFNTYNSTIKKYPTAPEIIDLEDKEKFYDSDGNVLNIETRGERAVDKCFFLARDVANAFGLNYNNLRDTINDKNSGYAEKLDYVYFDCSYFGNAGKSAKTLFFTYTGIARVLFTSRLSSVEFYKKQYLDGSFMKMLNNKNDRVKLVNKIIGANIDEVNAVLNTNSSVISCVYLICIGKASELKKSLCMESKFDDNDYVFKYGFTKNLCRRMKEHVFTYSKLKGAQISLSMFKSIDDTLISSAESDLRKFFKDNKYNIKHKKYNELILLSKRHDEKNCAYNKTVKIYETMEKKYSGNICNLKNMITAINNELAIAKERENTLKEKIKSTAAKYELIIANLKNELKIIKLENEVAMLKMNIK